MRKLIRNLAKIVLLLLLAHSADTKPAEAQQAGKVYRVGYLAGVDSTTAAPLVEAFRQGLRDRGYIEGKNILIEYRYAE